MTLRVWHNGSIWIDQTSRTTAIASQGEKVFALGEAALALIDQAEQVIDLAGGTMVPGFGDGHAHPINGGIEQLFAPVGRAENLAELIEIVKNYAEANPHLEIIRGEGYDPSLAPMGQFQASWLDAVVSDRPVVLRALDYHTAWLNSAALKWAGIDSETAQPNLGEIVLNPDGTPMGTLREWGAWDLAYQKLPKLTTEQKLAAVKYATNYYAACGVTWVQDAWVDDEIFESWLIGARTGILKQRVNLAWLASPLRDWKADLSNWLERKSALASEFGDQLTGNSVKIFVDGILEGGTAAVLEKYCDCPTNGISNWERAELFELVLTVIQNGFQPHIHAIGDAGIRDALDAIENAKNLTGATNNAVIAHSQLISISDRARYKDLGVIANFEPLWAQLSEEQEQLTIPRIGPERAALQYPIATMIELGTTVSFGSDWPVTSGEPMHGISTAITRQTPAGYPTTGWQPHERISLSQAVHAYTYAVAQQAGEESFWGALKPGFRADFAVFKEDLNELTGLDLANAKVVSTWLGGQQVFG